MTIILGIDPGSRITGYGVIKTEQSRYHYLASGCVRTTAAGSLADRLREIFAGISEIVQRYRPDTAAIEQVFVQHNIASALKLGQARGAAITAIASGFIEVAEYSPRQIKQAVVGYGAADKEQVQHMIQRLLNLSAMPPADAADALAVALCHAHTRQSVGYLTKSLQLS